MNLLDENTKTMLDAGQVAVLEGGYIVMSPETLKQVVQTASITAVEVFGDAISEQPTTEGANDSLVCSICGDSDVNGVACSRLILETGYGSANDMKLVTVPLCGECSDKVYEELVQMPGAVIDDIQM